VRNFIIKTTAWIFLFTALILGLAVFSLIFLVSIYLKEANLFKIVLLDMGIILFGLLIITLGIGFFEFILSLIDIEEKIEEIEEEVTGEEKEVEEEGGEKKGKEKEEEEKLEEI